jgi:hypothetical protein
MSRLLAQEGSIMKIGSRTKVAGRGMLGVFIAVGALLALPALVYSQEAAVVGTVSDSTGGVLPGVTIIAVHEATGNTFTTVTDGRGTYRLPLRIGPYRISAELSGFATVTRTGVELLVGQQAAVNLQMAPSTLQETVTVSAEAPLLDVTTSSLAGNIDAKQMAELPLNGRNWQDLAMLAPGSRANAGGESPVPRDEGLYQLNLDGQQVSTLIAGSDITGNPQFSRDAIAEFQFITNRFDATQGRSAGIQVNAVTKSGTNTFGGTLSGFFRDDNLNAADFIQRRVIPYSDQQVSGTFGGPIRRDRIHFFGSYEHEREPQTFTFTSPWPSFNIPLAGVRQQRLGGGRLDFEASPNTRMSVRASTYHLLIPIRDAGGATVHPSAWRTFTRDGQYATVSLIRVISSSTVNEIRAGYGYYKFVSKANLDPPSPRVLLRGYQIGTNVRQSRPLSQETPSIRNDFTTSYAKAGRHDLKLGGEYLYNESILNLWELRYGEITANLGPVPANIEQLFPVWNDPNTWNLDALAPITRRYRQAVGNFDVTNPRHFWAAWIQDDWRIGQRLTLNLGFRYDLDIGALGEKVRLLPFLDGNRPSDTDNFGPRVGFAYNLNDRTVIRGGYGKYFTQILNDGAHNPTLMTQILVPETPNDGRPDFVTNPYNNIPLTYQSVEATLCSGPRGAFPGCVRRDITRELPSRNYVVSYSHQASLGIQRQIGNLAAFETNWVFTGFRKERFGNRNANLTYNRETGANNPFSNISLRAYPEFGLVQMDWMEGWSNYNGWESSFTRRFSGGWQLAATYTLAVLRDSDPYASDTKTGRLVDFPVAPDLGADYQLAPTDQRHRAVVNGVWEMGSGFQVSGLYFYGSGARYATNFGGDVRDTGGVSSGRLRPDGVIVPRTALVGDPLHRVDVRLQKTFSLGGRRSIAGLVEVFNLFNHENYGSYTTEQSNARYGQPSFNNNVAYQPRIVQLGFRFAF